MSWKQRRRLYIERLGLILCTIVMMGFMWCMVSVADVWIHSYNGSENQWNMFVVCQNVR
ncbi:MAG: hypothetical protein WCR33_05490 [Bacilli bacterium]